MVGAILKGFIVQCINICLLFRYSCQKSEWTSALIWFAWRISMRLIKILFHLDHHESRIIIVMWWWKLQQNWFNRIEICEWYYGKCSINLKSVSKNLTDLVPLRHPFQYTTDTSTDSFFSWSYECLVFGTWFTVLLRLLISKLTPVEKIIQTNTINDDVIKWKHFPRYSPFVRGIHRLPANSPHKGQWRRTLVFSLICAWINGWVYNHETVELRRQLW